MKLTGPDLDHPIAVSRPDRDEADLIGDALIFIAHIAGIAILFAVLAAVMWSVG